MKKLFFAFGLIGILAFSRVPLEAKGVQDYPFTKNILVGASSSPVELMFDQEVLHQVNADVRNFQIVDQENTAIQYDLFIQKSGRLRDISLADVSSMKEGTDEMESILDNDGLTVFQFDPQDGMDEKEPAFVLIDLGQPRFLTRVELLNTSGPLIKSVLIRGGLTKKSLKTIVSERAYSYQYDTQFPSPVRYLKIYFWGKGMSLNDIRVYGFLNAFAYFTPQEGKQYKLLYGDPSLENITYRKMLSDPLTTTVQASLSKQKWNDAYPEDKDNDGIKNTFDNCFLHSNPSQEDTDGDGVGDACDNAPFVKNTAQDDSDFDSIGDVIDNCPLVYNVQQEDIDNDGIGDVCDLSFTEQETSISPISYILLLLIALAVFLFSHINRIRKTSSNKK